MAVLACETFTLKYCAASHLGGTIIARLSDGAIFFLRMGSETNRFRRDIANETPERVDNIFAMYGKRYKKDKFVTVHKQGHYIHLHNRSLGDKPWHLKISEPPPALF